MQAPKFWELLLLLHYPVAYLTGALIHCRSVPAFVENSLLPWTAWLSNFTAGLFCACACCLLSLSRYFPSGPVRLTQKPVCSACFSAGTIFFSHNNSARTVFFSQFQLSFRPANGAMWEGTNSKLQHFRRKKKEYVSNGCNPRFTNFKIFW